MLQHLIKIILCLLCVSANATQIILPFNPGGGTDTVHRIFAQYCANKQIRIIPSYKPGANGVVGTLSLINADPNGKTLGLVGADTVAEVIEKYPETKLEILGTVATPVMVLVTSDTSGITSYKKLEDTEKPLSFGYSSVSHLAQINQILYKLKRSESIIFVPYQGASKIMNDVMGGHVTLGFMPATVAMPNILSGKLRLLASTSKISGMHTVVLTEKYKDWIKPKGYVLIMPHNSPKESVKFWTDMLSDFSNDPEVATKLNNEYLY